MTHLIRSFALTTCGLLLLALANTADAGYPYGYGFNGVGGLNGLYGRGHFQTRPYFVLNPPVYYGTQINPQTYGRSPYAALPSAGIGQSRRGGNRAFDNSAPVSSGVIVNPYFGNALESLPPSGNSNHTETLPEPDAAPTPAPAPSEDSAPSDSEAAENAETGFEL